VGYKNHNTHPQRNEKANETAGTEEEKVQSARRGGDSSLQRKGEEGLQDEKQKTLSLKWSGRLPL